MLRKAAILRLSVLRELVNSVDTENPISILRLVVDSNAIALSPKVGNFPRAERNSQVH